MNQNQLDALKKNNVESHEFTRNCITAALVVLLKKNKLEDITVTKLCNVAGVSRVAFYHNFKSIADVLNGQIESLAHRLSSNISTDIYNNWLMIFKEVEKERQLFEILIKMDVEHKVYSVFMSFLPRDKESKTVQAVWISLIYTFAFKYIKEKRWKKPEEAARAAYKYTRNIPLVPLINEVK